LYQSEVFDVILEFFDYYEMSHTERTILLKYLTIPGKYRKILKYKNFVGPSK